LYGFIEAILTRDDLRVIDLSIPLYGFPALRPCEEAPGDDGSFNSIVWIPQSPM